MSAPLTQQAAEQLALEGHTLAVFGGLTPDGLEQQGSHQQLQLLWLHPDCAAWGTWLTPATAGPAPAPRAFAACEAIRGGSSLLVYGGCVSGSVSGTVNADVGVFDGYVLMCVYVLDQASLVWAKVPTRPLNQPPRVGHVMVGPSTCPGPRKQVLSCLRRSPVTGHEEFLLLGGCGMDGLADFVPYVLDLETYM